jgi:hypothetical protein
VCDGAMTSISFTRLARQHSWTTIYLRHIYLHLCWRAHLRPLLPACYSADIS